MVTVIDTVSAAPLSAQQHRQHVTTARSVTTVTAAWTSQYRHQLAAVHQAQHHASTGPSMHHGTMARQSSTSRGTAPTVHHIVGHSPTTVPALGAQPLC